jgi:hypothetical protein
MGQDPIHRRVKVINTPDVNIASPLETNGGIPINVQDQTTDLKMSIFAQSVSNFTLASDTPRSTVDTFYYTFTATAGHALSTNDEILLLDLVTNTTMTAFVKGVATNVITVDRPFTHIFAPATSLCRKVITDMSVNGSATPQVFTIRAGSVPIDYIGYALNIIHAGAGDDTTFGDIAELARGLTIRLFKSESEQTLSTVFKKHADFKVFGGSVQSVAKAGGGEFSTTIYLHTRDVFGVVQRLSTNQSIQIIVQDNLTGLTSIRAAAVGHSTQNETA